MRLKVEKRFLIITFNTNIQIRIPSLVSLFFAILILTKYSYIYYINTLSIDTA